MKRRFFKYFLILFCTVQVALAINLKRILRAIEKGDYEKAIEFLEEEIKEDPINPGAYLIYADLLSVDTLPYYDLDLARDYIKIAIDQYDTANQEILDELEKANIRLISLENTYDDIRQKTFHRSLHLNTLESYNQFIKLYPGSEEAYIAVEKRDSIAYENVKEIHTWEAYKNYIDTYPGSRFRPIAAVRYQRLLYLDRTKSGSLEDLESFVSNHPDNPYVNQVIEEILKKRSLQNRIEDFRFFVADYPESPVSKKALDILYHLDPDNFFKFPELRLFNRIGKFKYLDSITLVHEKNKPELVPILKNEKISLLTPGGKSFLPPSFTNIYLENAFCKPFKNDILAGEIEGKDVIINRISEIVYKGNFKEVRDLGLGALWIEEEKVIHKSGFIIFEDIEDARVFDHSLLKIKRKGKWALGTFAGLQLTPFRFDEINSLGNFWTFKKDGLIALSSPEKAFYEGFAFEYKYDDLELVSENIMIGFRNDRECLVDSDLNFLIPWGEHTVYPDSLVYYAKNRGGSYVIYNPELSGQLGNDNFKNVLVSENWLAVEKDWWRVMNLKEKKVIVQQFDSVKSINDHTIFTSSGDSLKLYFEGGKEISLTDDHEIYSVASNGTDFQFVLVKNDEVNTLYNQFGSRVLSARFDEISPLSGGFFKIEEEEKHGVIDILGNVILEPEYDLIQQKNDLIFTLEDGKIGSYDMTRRILFKPEYESAFSRIGSFYATSIDGKFGLLDSLKNRVSDFEFNEIKPLSDSLYWARTDTSWQVMKVGLSLPLKKGISDFDEIETAEKKYFQILTPSGYGLLSENGDELFSAVFSDLQFMEFEEDVLIRAEKYFVEADYYILVWYNQYGKKIYTAAYRGNEFEPLYCE